MDDQLRMKKITYWESNKYPRLKIGVSYQPSLMLAIPDKFWTNTVKQHNKLVNNVFISKGLLKHYVCLALQAVIGKSKSLSLSVELNDHVCMPTKLYTGHIWPRPKLEDNHPALSEALTLKDLDDTQASICRHTKLKLNIISQGIQDIKDTLENLSLNHTTVKSDRMADLLGEAFTNTSNGLYIRLQDVLGQLSLFSLLYYNPDATYDLKHPHTESLVHMINFCATLPKIPQNKHMQLPTANKLETYGTKTSSVAYDFRKLMTVSLRIKMNNYELDFTNNRSPKYLTYQVNSFYIVEVHYQQKDG